MMLNLGLMFIEVDSGHIMNYNWSSIIFPFLLSFYLYMLGKLYLKHKNRFEPVHVFELSSLLSITVYIMSSDFGLGNFSKYFPNGSLYCILLNYLQYCSRLSLFADLSASQLDRFLALYWSSSYKSRVTTRVALNLTIGVKIFMAFITLVGGGILDKDIFKCSYESIPLCNFFHRNNFYWSVIPMCLSGVVVFGVTLYVMKVIIKHQSLETPVVIIPKTKEEKYGISEAVSSATISAQVTFKCPRSESINENGEIRNETITPRIIEKIQRKNDDPNMFFKVSTVKPMMPEPPIPCFPIPELMNLTLAKTMLKANVQTICMLMLMIPFNALNVYTFVTNKSCSTDPNFISVSRFVAAFSVISSIFYPYLIKMKLDNFN